MLNEIAEFESYVNAPESEKPCLQPKLLTGNFSVEDNKGYKLRGIDQIMTMIVRGFIFSDPAGDFFDGDGLITDAGIRAARELLNRWCGFYEILEKGSEMPPSSSSVKKWLKDYPEADGWLKKFWICNYKKKSKKDPNAEWEKLAAKWYESFNNSERSYRAESVTFDNVIANAVERGPLRIRCCAIKKPDDSQKIRNIKEFFQCIFSWKGSPQIVTKMRMLKNIIAFLIWQEEHPGNPKEVLLQKLRLFGWYGKDDSDGKVNSWCFDQYTWNGEKIIYNISEPDFAKYGIKQDYLENFDIKLIAPEEAEIYCGKYWIIKDCGHGDDSLEIINLK